MPRGVRDSRLSAGKCRGDEMTFVPIRQYLRPNGQPHELQADVPDAYASRAKDMVFSAEVLTTGEVAIYARWKDQHEDSEIMELATNGPGDRNPTAMLCKLIDRLCGYPLQTGKPY